MQTFSSETRSGENLEIKLSKLTLQNNLQDITKIITEFIEVKDLKKKRKGETSNKKSKSSVSDINVIVQQSIQAQIKNYIDKIEQSLKKYWYTDMESKLYTFLNDLKRDWAFYEQFFQVDDSIDYLEETILAYVLDLKKQRAQLELDELTDIIANSFEYWPSQKAAKCQELATFLERKEEYEALLKETQAKLIIYNLENNTDLTFIRNLGKKFPLLQDKDINPEILKLVQKKITFLESEEKKNEILTIMDTLEESIVKGTFWDANLEYNILSKLPKSNQKLVGYVLKRFIQLITLYYSQRNGDNSIISIYPELAFIGQKNDINIEYEGVWSLDLFLKGKWYPAYRLNESEDFAELFFNQEGEWKNRKFKCFSWTLQGRAPVGTILRLRNKKEILHYIITNSSNIPLRDIDLGSIEETIIANYKLDGKEENKSIDFNKMNKNLVDNYFKEHFCTNSILIKLSIKYMSIDKIKCSFLSYVITEGICLNRESILNLLNSETDSKFINFVMKINN